MEFYCASFLRRRAFEVERQEPRQRFLFGHIGRPAIGGGDRGVEIAMRVVEPGRPLVVEVGQGALLEDRRGFVGLTGKMRSG